MQVIGTDINVPITALDVDVASAATVRSNVWANQEGTKACAVELHVTLLGANPVNLALRVLGQLSTPAADPTQLLQLNVAVPDTSALTANFTRIFVLPVFTPFSQLEVQNVSGGNVHVQAFVQGCDADFVDAAASGGTSIVQLAAGSADAGTVHLGGTAQTDLDTIASLLAGTLKAQLQAGTAAIGSVTVPLPSTGVSGQGATATPGTSQACGASATLTEGLTVIADDGNAGYIFVAFGSTPGDKRSTGAKLSAGKQVFLPFANPANVQIDGAATAYGWSYVGT